MYSPKYNVSAFDTSRIAAIEKRVVSPESAQQRLLLRWCLSESWPSRSTEPT